MLIKAISDAIESVKRYKKVHAETLRLELELEELKKKALKRQLEEFKAKIEAERKAEIEKDKTRLERAQRIIAPYLNEES